LNLQGNLQTAVRSEKGIFKVRQLNKTTLSQAGVLEKNEAWRSVGMIRFFVYRGAPLRGPVCATSYLRWFKNCPQDGAVG
jgi:hypothetical protein